MTRMRERQRERQQKGCQRVLTAAAEGEELFSFNWSLFILTIYFRKATLIYILITCFTHRKERQLFDFLYDSEQLSTITLLIFSLWLTDSDPFKTKLQQKWCCLYS